MKILQKWDAWAEQKRSPYILLAILAVINVLYILLVDIFPFQDMPQHLTYAKIIGDYGKSGNLFERYYDLTAHFTTYHTYHWVLSFLGRLFGIEAGFKVLLLLYFVSLSWGMSYLMDAYDPDLKASPWKKLLIQLCIWNATIGMGFMPFVQSMPFFTIAIGAFLRLRTGRGDLVKNWVVFWVALVLLSLTHVVTACAVVFFLALYTLFDRAERPFFILLANVLFFLVTSRLYGGLGRGGLTEHQTIQWSESFVHSYDFEFVTSLFNVTWSPLPVTMNYVFWNFIGPYQLTTLIPLALLYAVLVFILYRLSAPKKVSGGPGEKNKKKNAEVVTSVPEKVEKKFQYAYKMAAKIFLLFAIFLPWGIYIPSEITFINYRLLTLALFLIIGLWPWNWFEHSRQKLIVTFIAFLSIGLYSYKTYLYQQETKVPLRMISRIPSNRIVGSVVFGNRSEHFTRILRLTHFLPMYYTLRNSGINGQFWACYAPHLPVCYKPGKAVSNTPDWHPWKFKAEDLNDVDYLLYSTMYYANNPVETGIKQAILERMNALDCEAGWCLYRKK
ncbi:MAG: hypothetical protein A2X86_00875 [Bdellovibrionales bacterium GWA2_49_15]|nr:MAG: hypothetical protein A2X86_00875 [Bdellovibrionales bacterium GWA2_49_15]HAZ14585.1 hypothetical protein [Bdellovibrionales bacterium]